MNAQPTALHLKPDQSLSNTWSFPVRHIAVVCASEHQTAVKDYAWGHFKWQNHRHKAQLCKKRGIKETVKVRSFMVWELKQNQSISLFNHSWKQEHRVNQFFFFWHSALACAWLLKCHEYCYWHCKINDSESVNSHMWNLYMIGLFSFGIIFFRLKAFQLNTLYCTEKKLIFLKVHIWVGLKSFDSCSGCTSWKTFLLWLLEYHTLLGLLIHWQLTSLWILLFISISTCLRVSGVSPQICSIFPLHLFPRWSHSA